MVILWFTRALLALIEEVIPLLLQGRLHHVINDADELDCNLCCRQINHCIIVGGAILNVEAADSCVALHTASKLIHGSLCRCHLVTARAAPRLVECDFVGSGHLS